MLTDFYQEDFSLLGYTPTLEAALAGMAPLVATSGMATTGGEMARAKVELEDPRGALPLPPSEEVTANASNCRVRAASAMRVAVGFYGLFRNLTSTERSISDNLLSPLKRFADGDIDIFVHR